MTDRDRLEELYDAYLDRLLAGVEVDPAAFLEREGCDDAELLEKLASLHIAARIVPATPAEQTQPAATDLPCQKIGDYRLLHRLGRGGMGEVFLAEQENLGRQVALKILQESSFPTPNTSLRFHREARSLAKLRHPNVVTVFDFGVEDGLHYLVMEFIPGQDLSKTLQEATDDGEAIPPSTAVRWAAEIARALEGVHEVGILHRDVKPSNIRITPEGRAVLVDFGLVSMPTADGPTLTSSFLGSPSYASPEQVSGQTKLDARSDVFSLGTTLYRCITGQLPFEGDELEQLFHKILSVEAVAPKRLNPGIPRELDLVIRHAMEKDPSHRYASATAFAEDLEALLAFRPIQALPPSRMRRAKFWIRTHRTSSAVLLTSAVATLAFLIWSTTQSINSELERARDADKMVTNASVRFAEFLAIRSEIQQDSTLVNNLHLSFESQYVDPNALVRLDYLEDSVLESELKRERLFNGVLDLLDQAEALHPAVAGTDVMRAELYLSRHLESERLGDSVGSRFYKAQADRFDASPATLRSMNPEIDLHLQVSPSGPTEVFAFSFLEQSQVLPEGDHRMVPVALGSEPPLIAPGTWCLRLAQGNADLPIGSYIYQVEGYPLEGSVLVSRGNGRIQTGHRLLKVDDFPISGGFEIDQLKANLAVNGDLQTEVPPMRDFLFHDGEKDYAVQAKSLAALDISIALPQDYLLQHDSTVDVLSHDKIQRHSISLGCKTVMTTIPWLAREKLDQKKSEGGFSLNLPSGASTLLLRKPGHEDLILPIRTRGQNKMAYTLQMDPIGTTPEGYCRVTPGPFWVEDSFWVMQHEVTSSEYLEFLNSSYAQNQMQTAAQPTLFPRTFRNASRGGLWLRKDDGLFEIPADWHPELPVFAVSWFDAKEYAAWKNQQAEASGLPHRYRLPNLNEFRIASAGTVNWDYPYGPRFRPNWSNCCFSRPVPAAEPVMRYPIDQSVFGVFDTSGSALEWLDAWWDIHQTERFAGGGSWAQGGSVPAKSMSGLGIRPNETSMETSFRLVLEIADE